MRRRKLYYAVGTLAAPIEVSSDNFSLPRIVITDGPTVTGTPDRYGNIMEPNGMVTTPGFSRQAITGIFHPALIVPAASTGLGYGYFYNLASLAPVAIDAPFPFDTNGIFTADFTHTVPSTDITIVNAGTYHVQFNVTPLEANQAAIHINDGAGFAPVAGSIYGSGAGTQQNTGTVILTTVNPNAILRLYNYSSAAAVTPQTLSGGTRANTVNSVLIRRLSGGSGGGGSPSISLLFRNAITLANVNDPATVPEVDVVVNFKGFSGATVTGTLYLQKQHTVEA